LRVLLNSNSVVCEGRHCIFVLSEVFRPSSLCSARDLDVAVVGLFILKLHPAREWSGGGLHGVKVVGRCPKICFRNILRSSYKSPCYPIHKKDADFLSCGRKTLHQ
ncbi:hypothetical protein TNCV_4621041, partial [Trichonephila clavipes]